MNSAVGSAKDPPSETDLHDEDEDNDEDEDSDDSSSDSSSDEDDYGDDDYDFVGAALTGEEAEAQTIQKLRRKVHVLEKKCRDLKTRLKETNECEVCGAPVYVDDDVVKGDQEEDNDDDDEKDDDDEEEEDVPLSLSYLEQTTPHPVLERDDPAPPIKNPRTPQAQAAAFNQKCNWLRAYKAQYGHCNVRDGDRINKKLSSFVSKCRVQYKRYVRGEERSSLKFGFDLTPNRVKTLEDIGICWSRKQSTPDFDMMLVRLQEFHETYGHCCVPAVVAARTKKKGKDDGDDDDDGHADDAAGDEAAAVAGADNSGVSDELQALCDWSKRQRYALSIVRHPAKYDAVSKMSKPIQSYQRQMTPERRAALERLGCIWLVGGGGDDDAATASAAGEEQEEAQQQGEGKAEGGTTSGGEEAKDGKKKKKKGHTAAEKSATNANKNMHWFLFYEQLRNYKAVHGDCWVPTYRKARGLPGWITKQRRWYKALQRQSGGSSPPTTAIERHRLKLLRDMGLELDPEEVKARKVQLRKQKDIDKKKAKDKAKKAAFASAEEEFQAALATMEEAKRKKEEADRVAEAARKDLTKAKRCVTKARKNTEALASEKALDPVGKSAEISGRGDDRRSGTALVTGSHKASIVGEELIFYNIKWPDEETEVGIDGRFVTFTDKEYQWAVTKRQEKAKKKGARVASSAKKRSLDKTSGRTKQGKKKKRRTKARPVKSTTDPLVGKFALVGHRYPFHLMKWGWAQITAVERSTFEDKPYVFYNVCWPDGKVETGIHDRVVMKISDVPHAPLPDSDKEAPTEGHPSGDRDGEGATKAGNASTIETGGTEEASDGRAVTTETGDKESTTTRDASTREIDAAKSTPNGKVVAKETGGTGSVSEEKAAMTEAGNADIATEGSAETVETSGIAATSEEGNKPTQASRSEAEAKEKETTAETHDAATKSDDQSGNEGRH